ncbi:MAG: cell wall hydrolase [Clostridia bacterium]|nr:cell wall hydrolase [Clostridia bacterium]
MTTEMFEKTMKIMVRLIVVLTIILAILLIVYVSIVVSASDVADNTYVERIDNTHSFKSEPTLPSKPIAPVEEIPEEKVPLKELPETTAKEDTWYTEEELDLLARLIYFEARGECYEGQVAVGAVVMNRIKTSGFPNTIHDVIYQKNQFSPVGSSKWNSEITDYGTCYQAAIEALNGVDPTGGATFFYNPRISTSQWIFTRPVVKVIGNHNFAK